MSYVDSRATYGQARFTAVEPTAYFHCQACYTLNALIISIDYASRDFFVLSFHFIGRVYFDLGAQALACQYASHRIQRLATLSKAK